MSYINLGDIPTDCRSLCYDAKSVAYAICKNIPIAERKLRNDCFNTADKKLQDCLSKCPASKISGTTLVAATAVAAVLLLK